MAWTTTQLEDLEEAYTQGILSVSIAGKTITYRSRAEMRSMIDEARSELGVTVWTSARTRKLVTLGQVKRDK